MYLFRCELILLRTHWVLVVVDQFSRRIVGFGIQSGIVDGVALCRIFNHAIANQGVPVKLSTDNDPLFLFYRWRTNLRILDVEEIKTVPRVPLSHPFVERVIGTVCRELLDHVMFWNASDLERKLGEFQRFYNEHRVHTSLNSTPAEKIEKSPPMA